MAILNHKKLTMFFTKWTKSGILGGVLTKGPAFWIRADRTKQKFKQYYFLL